MRMILSGLCGLFLILSACGDSAKSLAEISVVPLYEEIYQYNTLDSIRQREFIERDSIALKAFMTVVSGEPFDAGLVESWAASRAVEVFTPIVDSVYRRESPLQESLGNILATAKSEQILLPHRRYAEIVYGRPESILFVDSVMLVALNHYLGADFEGYSHLPSYMRLVKTPEMLPFDVAEALVATSYPYQHSDESTVLSRLLYEGALAYARRELVGKPDISTALGYTPEQYAWLEDNEKGLWNALVSKGLIFDTSGRLASRLVDPSPSTSDLIAGAPGRAGRYIGYKLVCSYLKRHKGTPLSRLLSPDFYANPAILSEISYNP